MKIRKVIQQSANSGIRNVSTEIFSAEQFRQKKKKIKKKNQSFLSVSFVDKSWDFPNPR